MARGLADHARPVRTGSLTARHEQGLAPEEQDAEKPNPGGAPGVAPGAPAGVRMSPDSEELAADAGSTAPADGAGVEARVGLARATSPPRGVMGVWRCR